MSVRIPASRRRAVTGCLLACAAMTFGASSFAVENGALRIAPGWGGGELALPLLPGVTGTVGVTVMR